MPMPQPASHKRSDERLCIQSADAEQGLACALQMDMPGGPQVLPEGGGGGAGGVTGGARGGVLSWLPDG